MASSNVRRIRKACYFYSVLVQFLPFPKTPYSLTNLIASIFTSYVKEVAALAVASLVFFYYDEKIYDLLIALVQIGAL